MEPLKPRRKPMSEINVVPYIDVMLVLLIIFMVTAPMLLQGVDVSLPRTESESLDVPVDPPPVVVPVDAFGAYYTQITGEQSPPQGLGEVVNTVREYRTQHPDSLVLVRGDNSVAYGTVIELMGALRVAGVTDVGLVTEQPES